MSGKRVMANSIIDTNCRFWIQKKCLKRKKLLEALA